MCAAAAACGATVERPERLTYEVLVRLPAEIPREAASTIPVTPTGRTSRSSSGRPISASAVGWTTRAIIPSATPRNAIVRYSSRPARYQARRAVFTSRVA